MNPARSDGIPFRQIATADKMKNVLARGFLYSIGILINRVVPEWLFRFRIFNVYELGPNDAAPTASATGCDFKIRTCQTPSEFDEAERLTHYRPGKPSSQDDKLPSLQATLMVDSDVSVGGVWLSQDFFDESELGIRVRLRSEQTWLFAAFVSKSYRGKGVYRRLLDDVLSQTDKTVFASINPTNKASIAAHKSCIRRTVGTCVAIKFVQWSMCWASGDLQVHRNKRPIELLIGEED